MIKKCESGVIRPCVEQIHNSNNEVIYMSKIALLVVLISMLNPQATVTVADNVITVAKDSIVSTIVVDE